MVFLRDAKISILSLFLSLIFIHILDPREILVLHVFSVIAWIAGLFYLPRLFVYHSLHQEKENIGEIFSVMEQRLYLQIMTPALVMALLTGTWMILCCSSIEFLWLDIKIFLVLFLFFYHIYLGINVWKFSKGLQTRGSKFWRWMNEIPVLFVLSILYLVLVKPFS